jgi:SAM-dependent methyltransferase
MGRIVQDGNELFDTSRMGREIDHTVEFYDSHAGEYFERTVSADLSALYERFLRKVKRGGFILDAGSGSGRDLKELRSRGFRVLGIDASQQLARLASQYSGSECLPVRFEDIEFRNKFDGVWACASLLHIPKHKILLVLRRVYRSLHMGGALFVSVRTGQGEAIANDGRFFAYYTCSEFRTLLENVGFIIDDLWLSQDTLPGRESIEWINVVAHKAAIPASAKMNT